MENQNWIRRLCVTSLALVILAMGSLGATPALAAKGGVDKAGKILRHALPAFAGGLSLYKGDLEGVMQLGLTFGASWGTALVLKDVTNEERPDGSNDRSFPSAAAARAFAPAAYLYDRYGWEYGVPAYALASFVGYARVHTRAHHIHDVAASAVMAWGFSQLFTSKFEPNERVEADAFVSGDAAFLDVRLRW